MTFPRTRPARSAAIALSLCCLAALAALPVAASAGTPATVTVRVEDFGTTIVPETQVTTTTANVLPDKTDPCSGTSAGGALWDAIAQAKPPVQEWDGVDQPGNGYEVDSIGGVGFPAGFTGDAYWSIFVNGTFAQSGACSQELNPGDDVVFFAQCQGIGADCTSATAPDHFLTETPPAATTVQAGTTVDVTVGSVGTATGTGEPLPLNVTVTAVSASGAPVVAASPGAGGVAALRLSVAGTYTVQASAPDSVPSDSYTVCVHNGNDGNCGTSAPPGATTVTGASTVTTTPTGANAPGTTTPSPTAPTTTAPGSGVQAATTHIAPAAVLAAFASGVLNSHVYAAGHGPRTLGGHVTAPGSLSAVRLRLTRDDDGRCAYYDGVTERFRASRCGVEHGRFFDVGSAPTFSYLLPSRLGPGRYVFDIEGVDTAGHVSALYHGTSRMVFYVK